jgi:hypothetical protein
MKPNKLTQIKRRFAFVVDGECEYWYIQMMKENERSLNVTLTPEFPTTQKLSEQYKKVVELSKNHNKVFWIIDFDQINKETREAKRGKKTALQEFREYYIKMEKLTNVEIIINNPCFEYWYLLHFITTSKYFDSCEKLVKELIKCQPLVDYEKSRKFYAKHNNDIYKRLKPYLHRAMKNANKLPDFDFDNPQRGLTQMHRFFETDEIQKNIQIQ